MVSVSHIRENAFQQYFITITFKYMHVFPFSYNPLQLGDFRSVKINEIIFFERRSNVQGIQGTT